MEIKKVFGVLTCTLVFSIGLSGCSSDEDSGDGGGLTNMSQLVGSEWKRFLLRLSLDSLITAPIVIEDQTWVVAVFFVGMGMTIVQGQ